MKPMSLEFSRHIWRARKRFQFVFFSGFLTAVSLACVPAQAETQEDFFKGKNLRLIIGTGAGAAYDTFGRLVARNLGRFLSPSTNIVAENMPGVDTIKAANYIYSAVPKDGTAIGTFNSGIAFYEAIGHEGIRFKGTELNWIGAIPQDAAVIAVLDSPVKTLDDARKTEVVIGATGPTGTMAGYPALMNALFGTKFKIVTGYDGSNAVKLAMERGEVQGIGNNTWIAFKTERPEWIASHRIVALVQVGLTKDQDIPDVPLLNDLARTPEEHQMFQAVSSTVALGYAFAVAPGTPAERIDYMREAFNKMVRDSAFTSDAIKLGRIEKAIEPIRGEDVTRMVKETVELPPSMAEKLRVAMDPKPWSKLGTGR